jgi:transposase
MIPLKIRRLFCGLTRAIHWNQRFDLRWQDCPPEYGPYTTVYNRFNRWSARGIFQQIFETVAGSSEPPEQAALDSTHVKAHRCAGGGKGGPRNRRSVSPKVAGTARFVRAGPTVQSAVLPRVRIKTHGRHNLSASASVWLTASRNCSVTKRTTATRSGSL